MKKVPIVLVALLTMVVFVSGVVAQEKKGETAPAPVAEKTKVEKPKTVKAMKFSGKVAAYEAGKMIKVIGAKEKEMTFDVTPDAKIKGEVKEGSKVTVGYKKEGEKMIANSISVSSVSKAKAEKK